MSVSQRNVFHEAILLIRPIFVLKQVALALTVMLLSVLWLRLPDSSVLWLSLTVLLGLTIVLLAGAGESSLLLGLARQKSTHKRLAIGTLLLVLAFLFWHLTGALIEHLSASDGLRAGYLNSRFGQHARYLFTYEHIALWLGWLWSLLQAFLDGLIIALCIAPIAAAKPMQAILRTLRSFAFWTAIVLTFLVAPYVTDKLEMWVPGHGLSIELMSLSLRMLAILLIDSLIVSFLLIVLAVCVRRANEFYLEVTPSGTPLESQPRTVENP